MLSAKQTERAGVCFLVPYIGRWPKWSNLFFDSVGRNPIVDLVVVCTDLPRHPTPPNVRLYQLTSEELSHRLSQATGLKLGTISGHKLCDFRPFFGLAFADLLSGYQFWGFCDIDLLFGDLAKFLTPDFLSESDVFSAHDRQIVGHFTILRNNERLNHLAFLMVDWQQACLAPENAMVDENHFTAALEKATDVRWVKPNPLCKELASGLSRHGITFRFKGEVAYLDNDSPALVEVRDGKVMYQDETRAAEVLYVHFMGLKRWWHWLGYSPTTAKVRFSRIGFGGPSRARALDHFPWRQWWLLQTCLLQIKSRSGGILRQILPRRAFLFLRRAIFGRSRY